MTGIAPVSNNMVEVEVALDDQSVEYEAKHKLSTWQMIAYSHLRMCLSAADLTLRPARFSVYIEALKMSPGAQAALISICKSTDFVAGFIVGKTSDGCNTRFGRRRPFIMICFPIGMLSFLLFCMPTLFFKTAGSDVMPCSDLTGGDCDLLRSCLVGAFNISARTRSAVIPVRQEMGPVSNAGMLSVYFVLFYFGYYFGAWSGTNIPYDALGMELSDDSRTRATLFGVRSAFALLGYALPIGLQMVLNSFLAEDVPLQFSIMALLFASWSMASMMHLLCGISERKFEKEKVVNVPMVPQTRRMLANRPYRIYLWMRVPLSLTGLMPVNLVAYYIKFVMGVEGYIAIQSIGSLLFLITAIAAICPLILLSRRFERHRVLAGILIIQWFVFGICFACSSEFMVNNVWFLYILMAWAGVCNAAMSTILDPMLADIIDYDELLTGNRSEAMYTVLEANIVQFVEVVGGVLPLLVIEAMGYVSNGGCSCGCGVSCAKEGMPYARWYCPADVGFTCTGDLGSELLFGASRPAPCSLQNAQVRFALKFFFAGVPSICSAMAIIPAWRSPITPAVQKRILIQIGARSQDSSHICSDPLTGASVTLPTNSEEEWFRDHFMDWEQRRVTGAADVVNALKPLVTWQLAASLFALVAVISAICVTRSTEVLALGCLTIAAILVAIGWHGLRLRLLLTTAGRGRSAGMPVVIGRKEHDSE